MDVELLSPDDEYKTSKGGFRAREFCRIVSLIRPHRGLLALGLLATVVFASFHTLSIATAFPVFKVLLEEEGLHGWAHRTIAGERLGIAFAAPDGPGETFLTVLDVAPQSGAFRHGVRAGDRIADPSGRAALALLHAIADAEPGGRVEVMTRTGDRTSALAPLIALEVGAIDAKQRLLRWAVSWVPGGAEQDKLRVLRWLLVGLIIAVIVANVFRYVGEVLIAKAVLRTMMALRGRLYEHTLNLPMSFYSGGPTADIVTRFVQDVQEIQRGLMTLFGKFIREPLRAVFILGLAVLLDWRITLTMFVVAPLAVGVFWVIGRVVKKANRKLLQAYGSMLGALTTSLQNLRVVKAYTAESHECERLVRVDRTVLRQQLRLAKLQALTSPMIETLAVLAGSIAVVWLAGRVLDHELSPAKFMGLGIVLGMLFDPLRKLSDVYVRVQRSTAGAERVFQVFDQPIEHDPAEAGTELGPLKERIEFVHVWFTYPGAETPALSDVSLSIQQGETVAIVGPNGCGKTTLVSLLPRLFVPDTGEIRYDGIDIRRATLPSLRRQIGMVSQEAIVFAGTPIENITYGHSSDDVARVQGAARRASADAFIRDLPGGYESLLGERGTTLSGGQRQRLAIARAIFRDAPILIFDEATSQIDSESEQNIQSALRAFSANRTTLIIAHRLSTISFASRIIVMESGRVLDTGAHEELLDRSPLYRSLCETQFVRAG